MKNNALQYKRIKIAAQMEQLAKRDWNCTWFKLKAEDEIRCIQLLVWQEKYHVSVRWILKAVLPVWQSKYSKYRQAGLGVSIATLTGKVSEEILQQKIKEEFPDHENIVRWRAKEQQKQWDRQWDLRSRIEDWTHLRKTIQRYSRRMALERKERSQWHEKMQRRNYRNNPWI